MSSKKPKKNSINSGHYLELMDRLHVAACMVDSHCLQHPLTENEPEIAIRIEEALSQLLMAYQIVGTKEYDYERGSKVGRNTISSDT